MSLPDYNAAKHHVGLGPAGGTLKGYLLTGGYSCDPQRAGAPSDFGGERDLDAPSVLSRWTQDDFSGGAYQDIFANDPAMFAYSKNFLPNQMEKSARSVPPLVHFANAGNPDASAAIEVFTSGGKVHIVEAGSTRHYNVNTGAVTTTNTNVNTVVAAAHDPTDNVIYSITRDTGDDTNRLRYYSATVSPVTVGTFPIERTVGGLEMLGKDFLACLGQVLYLCDVNDARTATTFTRLGRLPGRWTDSCVYNGLIYILCTDLEQRTAVFAWDGSQILPVVEFPYNFIGKAIKVYGGRVFVCGSGRDITGADRYAELYEITGSSLRTVRTFSWEARSGIPSPATFYSMVVHEGLLFIGTDRSYLVAYDLTRDALWSEIQIVPDVDLDGILQAKHLISTNEKLFAWCDDSGGSGGTSADGFYRLATADADLTDFTPDITYTCYIETSDFVPEPGRDKVYSNFRVLTRYSAAPTLEYSTNGGASWTGVSQLATTGSSSGLRTTDFNLAAITPSPAIRFRISIAKTIVALSEILAFTMTFLFLDTGKRGWRMTVLGADQVEQYDGTTLDQDTATLKSTLWGFWTNRTTLDFTDLDGTTAKVTLSDLNESQPIVGPALPDGSMEAFYSLVLTEI